MFPLFQNITGDFHAIAKTFLVQYVTDVVLYSPNADLEFRRNFLVTQTAGDREGHPIFSLG